MTNKNETKEEVFYFILSKGSNGENPLKEGNLYVSWKMPKDFLEKILKEKNKTLVNLIKKAYCAILREEGEEYCLMDKKRIEFLKK